MPERSLSNARVQSWLAGDLARIADDMDCSRSLVNSAAVWWFCHRLPAEERARVLGDFVTAQAMRNGSSAAEPLPPPPPPLNNRHRRRPKGG